MKFKNVSAVAALAVLATFAAGSVAGNQKASKSIEQAVAGDWRKPEAKARDAERHPVDALAFWGLKPEDDDSRAAAGRRLVDGNPGAVRRASTKASSTRPRRISTIPGISENASKGRADFAAKYADAAVYGKVNLVNWGAEGRAAAG